MNQEDIPRFLFTFKAVARKAKGVELFWLRTGFEHVEKGGKEVWWVF